jgi:BirA family biotin operon repressor/biotin-[acetyl-CoA-carboxylase] ligase
VADLLSSLRRAKGPLSGAALAKASGLSRAAIHKQIQKLRAQGHRISGVNRLGYRLESAADVFDGSAFPAGWGRPFFYFEETTSTQEEAKSRAARGLEAGALFIAGRQTAGRGRLGRTWESPAGGLWYSLVLRPEMPPAAVPSLTLVAALDWALTLQDATGLDAKVKWPNDVWVGKRKVAGILTEMSSEADRVHWVVLGVGLNVNNAPPAGTLAPAASLKSLTGRAWSRQDLLAAWLKRFRTSLTLHQRKGFAARRAAFSRHSLLTGREVSFERDGGEALGKVTGVDAEGRLLVRTARWTEALTAGDVKLRI